MPLDYPYSQIDTVNYQTQAPVNPYSNKAPVYQKPYNNIEPVESASQQSFSLGAIDNTGHEFNRKVLWGMLRSRLIPSTKHTLAKVMSYNIKRLSRTEYTDLRYMINYIAKDDKLKNRMFELTGFEQKDLDFARKYFLKYRTKGLFSRLIKVSMDTSSNGRVARQIGGLTQFILEVDKVNGVTIPLEYKLKLLGNIPRVVDNTWQRVEQRCIKKNYTQCIVVENINHVDFDNSKTFTQQDMNIVQDELKWLREYLASH